jgi:hypothetical protein
LSVPSSKFPINSTLLSVSLPSISPQVVNHPCNTGELNTPGMQACNQCIIITRY